MNRTTGISGVARKVSFTFGTVVATGIMAFAGLGGVASAHTSHNNSKNVQVNVQSCHQVALSEAKYFAFTSTKQGQACIFLQSNNSKQSNDPKSGKGHGNMSNVQINIQSCSQFAGSKAKVVAATHTKQGQLCIFAQKNGSRKGNH